jgi:hypothetical protein
MVIEQYNKLVQIMDKPYYEYLIEHELDELISLPVIVAANSINKYFINQKLILIGFQKSDEGLLVHDSNDKDITAISCDITEIPNSLERRILLSKGSDVYLTPLSAQKLCGKAEFEMAAKILVNMKLGELTMKKKDNSSRKGLCFSKKDPVSFQDETSSLEIVNNLISFKINIDEYKKTFE